MFYGTNFAYNIMILSIAGQKTNFILVQTSNILHKSIKCQNSYSFAFLIYFGPPNTPIVLKDRRHRVEGWPQLLNCYSINYNPADMHLIIKLTFLHEASTNQILLTRTQWMLSLYS